MKKAEDNVIAGICPVCGKSITYQAWKKNKQKFCSRECVYEARRAGLVSCVSYKQSPETTFEKCRIKILRQIPIYKNLRPEVGEIYEAEKYSGLGGIGYVISVNGKRINVRADECKEVVG